MYDTGTTAFMLVSTMLVLLMTPGLAFFYGGLTRRKNVLNTMLMCFGCIGVVGLVWVIAGWSFAYGGDGSLSWFGGFDQLGLNGMVQNMLISESQGTIDVDYPSILNVSFQMAFAIITAAIITGSCAGRIKFSVMMSFIALWILVVYAPLAHMVWGGKGSLIGSVIGALDFAGGDVVHISSGITGLMLAFALGARRDFALKAHRPHNVPFVALGAGLLWFGWFGFNGGSAFKADSIAALALTNTLIASAAGLASWMCIEYLKSKKPTLVGASTGLVAGLVVVTPAAGFVEPYAALIMGLLVSPVCYVALSYLKPRLGYDDALDAFGCHGVGGILGGILTGIFCVPDLSWTSQGGLLYTGSFALIGAQMLGIVVTLVLVVVANLVLIAIMRVLFNAKLRVAEKDEALGLDLTQHGESAYPAFSGFDA